MFCRKEEAWSKGQVLGMLLVQGYYHRVPGVTWEQVAARIKRPWPLASGGRFVPISRHPQKAFEPLF